MKLQPLFSSVPKTQHLPIEDDSFIMDDFLAPIQDAFEGQIVSFGHLAFNAVLPRFKCRANANLATSI